MYHLARQCKPACSQVCSHSMRRICMIPRTALFHHTLHPCTLKSNVTDRCSASNKLARGLSGAIVYLAPGLAHWACTGLLRHTHNAPPRRRARPAAAQRRAGARRQAQARRRHRRTRAAPPFLAPRQRSPRRPWRHHPRLCVRRASLPQAWRALCGRRSGAGRARGARAALWPQSAAGRRWHARPLVLAPTALGQSALARPNGLQGCVGEFTLCKMMKRRSLGDRTMAISFRKESASVAAPCGRAGVTVTATGSNIGPLCTLSALFC